MSSDVKAGGKPSGGLFPPTATTVPTVPTATTTVASAPTSKTLAQRVADIHGLNRTDLRHANATATSTTLVALWAAMTNRPAAELAAGSLHKDGTPELSSQIAVWMIGRISEAYGRRKLINLAQVKDLESLRSVGGLTTLLRATINADTEGTLV